MTTQERLKTGTCYRGPGRDRLTISEASTQGLLKFQVWVRQAALGFGESACKGSFQSLDSAIQMARKDPRMEVHAVVSGWNFPECLIWSHGMER